MKSKAIWLGAAAVMALACPALGQSSLSDVPPQHWASGAVKELKSQGIITGYPDGTFGGQRAVTRYEFAIAAQRVLQEAQRRIDHDLAPAQRPGAAPAVTREVLDQRLRSLATHADVDQLHAEVDELRRALSQLQVRTGTLRSEVGQMRQQVGDMNSRVSGVRSQLPLGGKR